MFVNESSPMKPESVEPVANNRSSASEDQQQAAAAAADAEISFMSIVSRCSDGGRLPDDDEMNESVLCNRQSDFNYGDDCDSLPDYDEIHKFDDVDDVQMLRLGAGDAVADDDEDAFSFIDISSDIGEGVCYEDVMVMADEDEEAAMDADDEDSDYVQDMSSDYDEDWEYIPIEE